MWGLGFTATEELVQCALSVSPQLDENYETAENGGWIRGNRSHDLRSKPKYDLPVAGWV